MLQVKPQSRAKSCDALAWNFVHFRALSCKRLSSKALAMNEPMLFVALGSGDSQVKLISKKFAFICIDCCCIHVPEEVDFRAISCQCIWLHKMQNAAYKMQQICKQTSTEHLGRSTAQRIKWLIGDDFPIDISLHDVGVPNVKMSISVWHIF